MGAEEGAAGEGAARAGLRGDIARLLSAHGTRQGAPSVGRAAVVALTRPGPMAVVLYRLSHRLWERGWRSLAEVVWRVNFAFTGADIHPEAVIGGGLRLPHTSGVVVGRGAKVGSNVTLMHGATLGGSGRQWFDESFEDGFPTVGDYTWVMSGAKVLGPITVGRRCFVAANAVLTRDLGDGEAYTPSNEIADLRRRVEELERLVVEQRSPENHH